MKKQIIVLFTSLSLLASCTSTIDKKIDTATIKEDIEKIKEEYKDTYQDEDYEAIPALLLQKAFNKALAGEKLDEKDDLRIESTYKEALDQAKLKREEYEQKLALYKNGVEQFKKNLEAGVISKNVYGNYEFEKNFKLSLNFKNNTQKDIKGVQGTLEVYDMFDKHIENLAFNMTEPILANSVTISDFYWELNYNDKLKEIAYSDIDKLSFKWMPEVILYSDGSKEAAPPKPEK